MGKPKMLGMFKPCTPNSRHFGSGKKAPWDGAKKKAKIPKQQTGWVIFDEITPYPPRQEREGKK